MKLSFPNVPCLLAALALCSAFPSTGTSTEPDTQTGKKKYLIVHADDAGMSHSANRGTIEGMQAGVVTSASIMVPCPWFKEFAEHCRKVPQGDYGIHLTLTSEWTNYRWGPVAQDTLVPSLIDTEGYLWDNVAQVVQHVKADEAKRELSAQIDRALEFGVPLSHLDTHMGALLSRPDLVQVYLELGLEYDLPILFVDLTKVPLSEEYPALKQQGLKVQQALASANLPVLDAVGQFYGGDSHEQRREAYYNFLRELRPGVSELIIHCGFDDEELRGITSSAARRNGDRMIFTDPATRALIDELGIELITWKAFRDMQSAGD